MCKNCINYLNEKVYALISLIIATIFGILLFVVRKDSSKTATINSIDKLVSSILDIFVLLKDVCCHKKEANVTAEQKKKISPYEEGKALLSELNQKKKTIDNIKKFVADNIKSQDKEIKKEVVEANNLLPLIKKAAQDLIDLVNIN